MEMLSFLLITLICFLAMSYLICDKDIMAPEVLFVAGFVLSVIAAAMNIKAWGIDLSFETFMLIVTGVGSFLITGLLYRATHKRGSIREHVEIRRILVAKWKTVVVISFGILTIFLYYREIIRLSKYAEIYWQSFGVMVAYKRVISYGNVPLNPIVNQMTKAVYSFGYIYMYIFMNNCFVSKEKHCIRLNIKNLIPIAIFVVMSIFKGNRIDIMQLAVTGIFLYYMFWNRKEGWSKHISGKMIRKALIVFTIGMILFYYMKELVGRVSSLNFLEYITQYIGGSIQLLDQYMKEPQNSNSTPFGETLTGLILGLKKLGFTTISLRKQLKFRYTPTGVYLGNVYTALRRYYNDAGWFGVIIFPAALSLFMNRFYRRIQSYKGQSIKQIFKVIVYASLLYVIPLQAMEDAFFINKITIGYIIELLILYFCVYFVFKNMKVKAK